MSEGKADNYNVSEGKEHSRAVISYHREKKARKSQAEIDFRHRRIQIPRPKEERSSV